MKPSDVVVKSYYLFNPEQETQYFDTLEEAVASGNTEIKNFLSDDGEWYDDVGSLGVGLTANLDANHRDPNPLYKAVAINVRTRPTEKELEGLTEEEVEEELCDFHSHDFLCDYIMQQLEVK